MPLKARRGKKKEGKKNRKVPKEHLIAPLDSTLVLYGFPPFYLPLLPSAHPNLHFYIYTHSLTLHSHILFLFPSYATIINLDSHPTRRGPVRKKPKIQGPRRKLYA